VTDAGFTFFTNYNSSKSKTISENSNVSLLFPWYPMERQVKVLGSASRISEADSDSYFATRPWSSQIGAWASDQSAPLSSREELEERWAEFAAKFPEGSKVPRPSHWGGFIVMPTMIEFWQGRYSRLHDRIRYNRSASGWSMERYYP
jgi:pyridoxamine 5'-phosphate oxidase